MISGTRNGRAERVQSVGQRRGGRGISVDEQRTVQTGLWEMGFGARAERGGGCLGIDWRDGVCGRLLCLAHIGTRWSRSTRSAVLVLCLPAPCFSHVSLRYAMPCHTYIEPFVEKEALTIVGIVNPAHQRLPSRFAVQFDSTEDGFPVVLSPS